MGEANGRTTMYAVWRGASSSSRECAGARSRCLLSRSSLPPIGIAAGRGVVKDRQLRAHDRLHRGVTIGNERL